MRVLITNDDGIRGPGLQALVDKRPPGVEVWVMAPDRERSATGHAITIHKPLRVHPVDMGEGVRAFHVNGTPSDCVKLGLELMEAAPDVVLSGINRGCNMGTDVMYSGTVSGAIEAALYKYPAMALSLDKMDADVPADYDDAAEASWRLAEKLVQHGLPTGTLLNVNFPASKPLHGVSVTSLSGRRFQDVVHKRTDPSGRTYYWLTGDVVDPSEADEMTDAAAVHQGYVSVTPIHFDLTAREALDVVRSWGLT